MALSSESNMNSLPRPALNLDIILLIFEHLQDDGAISTLKTCALVSSIWHPHAYRQIFAVLDLRKAHPNPTLKKDLAKRLLRIIWFCKSKPFLKTATKSIYISTNAYPKFDLKQPTEIWHFIPLLLSNLPNLVQLDIRVPNWPGRSEAVNIPTSARSQKYISRDPEAYKSRLQTLSLNGVWPFEFCQSLVEGTGTSLRSLRLVNSSLGIDHIPNSTALGPMEVAFGNISSLSLGSQCDGLFDALLRTPETMFKAITKMTLSPNSLRSAKKIWMEMQRMNKTLTNVVWKVDSKVADLTDRDFDVPFSKEITLKALQNLTGITLSIPIGRVERIERGPREHFPPPDAWAELLRTCENTTNIQRVNLRIMLAKDTADVWYEQVQHLFVDKRQFDPEYNGPSFSHLFSDLADQKRFSALENVNIRVALPIDEYSKFDVSSKFDVELIEDMEKAIVKGLGEQLRGVLLRNVAVDVRFAHRSANGSEGGYTLCCSKGGH